MTVEEIKTPDHISDQTIRKQRCDTLYACARQGSLPPLKMVMSMDQRRLTEFVTKLEVDHSFFLMYSWDSTPEGGFAKLTSFGRMEVGVSWGKSGYYEVRVTNPNVQCLVLLGRNDWHKFRVRVDGEYYNGTYIGITL